VAGRYRAGGVQRVERACCPRINPVPLRAALPHAASAVSGNKIPPRPPVRAREPAPPGKGTGSTECTSTVKKAQIRCDSRGRRKHHCLSLQVSRSQPQVVQDSEGKGMSACLYRRRRGGRMNRAVKPQAEGRAPAPRLMPTSRMAVVPRSSGAAGASEPLSPEWSRQEARNTVETRSGQTGQCALAGERAVK